MLTKTDIRLFVDLLEELSAADGTLLSTHSDQLSSGVPVLTSSIILTPKIPSSAGINTPQRVKDFYIVSERLPLLRKQMANS